MHFKILISETVTGKNTLGETALRDAAGVQGLATRTSPIVLTNNFVLKHGPSFSSSPQLVGIHDSNIS